MKSLQKRASCFGGMRKVNLLDVAIDEAGIDPFFYRTRTGLLA